MFYFTCNESKIYESFTFWNKLQEKNDLFHDILIYWDAPVVPGTALHVHITSPNGLRYFKGPYSLEQQNNQNPQRHWPNK